MYLSWAWSPKSEPVAFAYACVTDPVLARLLLIASLIVFIMSHADSLVVSYVVV